MSPLFSGALKDFKPMPGFSSLRVRLVAAVFSIAALVGGLFWFLKFSWGGLAVAAVAAGAAWIGSEIFFLRPIQRLIEAVRKLGSGDAAARTAAANQPNEFGAITGAFEQLAARIQQRSKQQDEAERTLLNRAHQQTAVAALGQFALTSSDFSALLNQCVGLVSQTLETDHCAVFERIAAGKFMRMQAGTGWKSENLARATVSAEPDSFAGHTLNSGEPLVIKNVKNEKRFPTDPLFGEYQLVACACVPIGARRTPFGILAVFATHQREFNGDDLQFLMAMANVLASAAERRKSEAEIKKLAEFTQLNPNPALELGADGAISYFNQAALRLAKTLGFGHPGDDFVPKDIRKLAQSCLANGQSMANVESRVDKRVLSWSLNPVSAAQVVHCYVTDVTERLNLESQLRHSQKMESVGQLAAGVAHDFNNMLTVIQGHAGILMARPNMPPQMRDSLQAMYFATERAAALTSHLLLFSRKNATQMRPLDLVEIVRTLSKVLKRLVGDAIRIEFAPGENVPLIQGDPAMIEQAIVNLTINARDAMPSGGTVIFTVRPSLIDAAYVRSHPEAHEGSFVCLCVIDTGGGMDAETMSRVFEPFFTAKDGGQGTGLGLATVYGIAKQHDGWVEVASEVGKGSAFAMFFPASTAGAQSQKTPVTELLSANVRGGNETILVVEDEPSVRSMVSAILQDCGYRVLQAASGAEALQVWKPHSREVDLLLTDLVMPDKISGIELARKLPVDKPGLKIILTSGYNLSDADTDFISKTGATFLQKPYTRSTLASAVRKCLDKGN